MGQQSLQTVDKCSPTDPFAMFGSGLVGACGSLDFQTDYPIIIPLLSHYHVTHVPLWISNIFPIGKDDPLVLQQYQLDPVGHAARHVAAHGF